MEDYFKAVTNQANDTPVLQAPLGERAGSRRFYMPC